MEKEKRHLKIAVVLLITIILFSIELPYSDKSLVQYLIPNIFFNSGGGSLILSNLILLVGLIWSFVKIVNSKLIKTDGYIIFIILLIVLQMSSNYLDIVKAPIYLTQEGVNSIEVKDSSLNIWDWNDGYEALLRVDMKYYKELDEKVKVRLILPKEAREFFKKDSFILEQKGQAFSDGIAIFRGSANLELEEDCDLEKLSSLNFNHYDYKIVIILDTEERSFTRNDYY